MKRYISFAIGLWFITSLCCFAQEDAHLKKLTNDLIQLRKAKASSSVLNKTVLNWSASSNPKITLMDDIKRDEINEYRGNGANKFKLNQIVTYVYNRQNTGLTSKGDYFNSTEKDIFYSAIEKNIKKSCAVTYKLMGHLGAQEFVLISFNSKTKFTVTINGKKAKTVDEGVQYIKLDDVKKDSMIIISINNESTSNESFVILNHNPQK